MSNLDILAGDLIAKLLAIPGFENRVGLALGGTQADPNLSMAPIPLAWVVFKRARPTDPDSPRPASRQSVRYEFSVFTVTKYTDQAGLLTTQYPLLDAVEALGGSNSPLGLRWLWEGTDLVMINTGRQHHEIKFSINAHIQQQ